MFDPPGIPPISHGLPLAYKRLFVLTFPAEIFAVNVPLFDVISPLANIIFAGTSPTEKPATEFSALIAILLCPYKCIYLFLNYVPVG